MHRVREGISLGPSLTVCEDFVKKSSIHINIYRLRPRSNSLFTILLGTIMLNLRWVSAVWRVVAIWSICLLFVLVQARGETRFD